MAKDGVVWLLAMLVFVDDLGLIVENARYLRIMIECFLQKI